jgi:AraC family transcriptional activator of mtrCDE
MHEAEIFSELAPLLRVRPELQQICRFGAQWGSEHGPEAGGWAPFHIVTYGACLLDVGDRIGIELKAGDAAVLPHGGPHTVRALPSGRRAHNGATR